MRRPTRLSKTGLAVTAVLLLASCGGPAGGSGAPGSDAGEAPAAAPEFLNVVAAGATAHFAGWPANNGTANWTWGDELLIGLSYGELEEQEGHNVVRTDGVVPSVLSRSLDGGRSWTLEDPEGYVGDGGAVKEPPGGVDFSNPDFAFRVAASGYLAWTPHRGAWFHSADRGRSWSGPFGFGGLMEHPELAPLEFTARTDYVVMGPSELLVLMSARDPEVSRSDKVFAARTVDGGASWSFVSWVVPPSDPHRAVMPATVRISDEKLVTAIRRRTVEDGPGWIDAYASDDAGESWSLLSRVGETGAWNGNPPGLVRLRDGRLFCIYGNRDQRQILGRYSGDEGATWGAELVIRDDYSMDSFGDPDLGYPRVTQNAAGELVATYYWATAERPWHHIAATLWKPLP
jgi:hypothetical protein